MKTKPTRAWSQERKLQRRQERYAAKGPNCPNGHSWIENAKFNCRGYRFCNACTAAKAEERRNDPATYTGCCPHGHPFTRANTLITNQNARTCLACAKNGWLNAPVTRISKERIQLVLEKARAGVPRNEIIGQTPSKRGQGTGLISNGAMYRLVRMDTPEAKELKQLLEKNAFRGRRPYRWSQEQTATLIQMLPSSSISSIAKNLNRMGGRFTTGAIYSKVHKLGLERVHIIRSSIPTPILTGIIAAPSHEIFTVIDRCVPRYLDFHKRKDVMQDMMLAVLEGRLALEDAPRRYREFLRLADHMFPTKFAPRSIDEPAFRSTGSRMPLIETLSEGLWA